MMPVLLILLLTFSVFVGCGDKGAGVSTDSQASHDTKQVSQLERKKTLTTEKRASATITVPVVPLIGESWGELAREGDTLDGELCQRLWEQSIEGKPPEDKDQAVALTCAFDFAYIYAFTPTMGWPVEPKSHEGSVYIVSSLAHVLAANNVASEVAAQLTGHAYRDIGAAKAEIKEFLATQRSYFSAVYPMINALAQTRGVIDSAGKVDGLAFSKGVYHLHLSAGGAVVKYSGVDWFGNGNLSGNRYELQLASMTGVAMKRGQTVTQTSEQKAGESSKATAGVK